MAGNDFDVTVTAVAIDSNGNGVYDAGVDELMAEPQTTAELAPDAVLTLFVLATVPEDVSDTQTSNVELAAEAVTGNGAPGTVFAAAGVDGGDAIVGTTEARAIARGSLVVGITSVALAKAVTLRDPFGGESAVPGSIASFNHYRHGLGQRLGRRSGGDRRDPRRHYLHRRHPRTRRRTAYRCG